MSALITQSLFIGHEYYLFRDIGNDTYLEIKFHIINNQIVEIPNNSLKNSEKSFIQYNYLS